ncbi:MAG TPA: M43 family zinc metalloprotease, partial [Bacteroidia bacterium]|nr:M43 family zinc metalloprotease [Bacteroidia bacterium]
MNLIRTMALLLWVALLCPFANGQITCGFDEDQDSLLAQDSMYKWKYHEHANYVNWYRQNYNLTQTYQQTGSGTAALTTCNRAIFIVPVVFHVMYDPSVPATNVSDSIIEAQLDMMNKAFANQLGSTHPNAVNTEIQFCLAQKRPNGTSFSGINRVSYTGSHNKPSGAQKAGVAAAIYYDRERYVNIWIVKDIKDANGISTNIAGYSNVSYQAGIDGIVIRYDFMGDYAGCNSCFNSASGGRVLAHEMGHFLGLFHTFQGNNCSNSGIDSTDCDRKGDLCCDTRPCFEQFDCPTGTTQPDCPNLPFYAGQDDNRNNIMSYADQPCQNNFTLNQTQIMQAVLMGKRQGLIETKNLNHLALSCCHRSAWFNASNTFMCNPSTVKFSAVKQTGVTYRWLIALGGNIVMDTTLSVDSFNFFVSTQGIYDVLLEVSDSTGVISLPRQGFLEYADCGNNLASTQGNWYFGRYAGLRFTTVGPVKDLSAAIASPPTIYCGEGSVSHSDNNGQLIFYGGGDSLETNPYFRIYKDSIGFNHIEVNKDNLLTGHTSSAQGGIVIPFDGNTNKFYLIVTGGAYQQSLNETVTTGARYSIIDRTKPNIVDTPNVNIPILPPAGADDNTDGAVYCGEFITAIPRCGGGHWLILKYIGTGSYSNKILVYLVTDSTITFHSSAAASINDQYFGQLKASPDGNFVAAPGYIFRFNPNTGILILFREYQTDPYNQQYYGCSFSPNSKVLYVTEADYNNFSFKLIQFDLLSTNDSLSRREIDVEDNFYFFQSLQLAPDNRIYMARAGVPQVAVINFPDNLNSQSNSNNCSFELNGPELQNSNGQGGTCVSGLPNMMDALSPGQFTLDFYHIDSNCRTVKFFPNKFCDTVVKWFFGDGDSSTSQFPEHTYAVSDSFTVRMEMSGGAFVQKRIKIGLDNPIIAGDSFVSCNASTQHVYSISNLNDRLHYTWAKNGTSILDVDNFYNANVTISGLSNQLTVEAADPRTGCKAYDTLVVVRGATPASDTLWADSLPCIESSQVTLRGHKYANTAYQWYYSKDSVNWTAISGATADTLTTTLGHDSAYFKRYISNFGCAAYSNVAKLKPQIYISRQPENYVACHGNTIYYDIEVGNPLGASISYAWQGINLQGNWATIATTPYLTNGTTPAPGDTIIFRCLIITPCDTIYSDTVYAVSEPRPDFLIHPQTQTVNEESNAIFIAKGNAIKEQSYQWFYSWNNGANWDSIPGEHNDTLAINNVSMCNDNFQYAAVVYNSCSYLFGSESSDAATLSVNKTRFADLWWRDNLWDGGVEPTIDSNGIWYSPDLWVRRNADGDTNHQNPDYDTATSNYIYYRIKNRGTDTSKGGELYLYWSKTGFGERWPIDWTSNSSNVYVNPC